MGMHMTDARWKAFRTVFAVGMDECTEMVNWEVEGIDEEELNLAKQALGIVIARYKKEMK